MMSCHISHAWWEWNVNPNEHDIMLMYDITSGMHDSHACAGQTSLSNSCMLLIFELAGMHASQVITKKNNRFTF